MLNDSGILSHSRERRTLAVSVIMVSETRAIEKSCRHRKHDFFVADCLKTVAHHENHRFRKSGVCAAGIVASVPKDADCPERQSHTIRTSGMGQRDQWIARGELNVIRTAYGEQTRPLSAVGRNTAVCELGGWFTTAMQDLRSRPSLLPGVTPQSATQSTPRILLSLLQCVTYRRSERQSRRP
jgi:hypothetical protein